MSFSAMDRVQALTVAKDPVLNVKNKPTSKHTILQNLERRYDEYSKTIKNDDCFMSETTKKAFGKWKKTACKAWEKVLAASTEIVSSSNAPKSTVVEGVSSSNVPKATVVEDISTPNAPKATVVEVISAPNVPKATVVEGVSLSNIPKATVVEGVSTPNVPKAAVVEGVSLSNAPKASTVEEVSTSIVKKATSTEGALSNRGKAGIAAVVVGAVIGAYFLFRDQKANSAEDKK